MKKTDVFTLLFLSAVWGASFLFMRIGAADFGPFPLAFIRMLSAFLCIAPLLMVGNRWQNIVSNAGNLALLGLFNQVLPFTLFSFAMLRLEAGFTSLISATTPIFTALVGFFIFANTIHRHQIIGLGFAFFGIFVLSSDKLDFATNGQGWAILAGLMACTCYGWSANFVRRLSHMDATEITLGSTLASSLLLAGPALVFWPANNPKLASWASAIALGMLCTGFALLLFYRLIRRAGPVSSTTVTILVPLFAIAWGVLLLNETVTIRMLIGMVLALIGTAVSLGLINLHQLKISR